MTVKQLMTAEELLALTEQPGLRYELVEGVLVEVPGAGALHGLIIELVVRLVGAFARERDLGLAFGDGVGYLLRRAPDVVRIPDASFVSWERVPAEGVPEGFWPGAPDLAVEVVSPGDRADDIHDKVREYLAAGTRLVWVLWPRHRAITIYEPGGRFTELGAGDTLDGGAVLPGFRVGVEAIFAIRRER